MRSSFIYLFHLEQLEWLLNRQKGDGIYFWGGDACAAQFPCNIQHLPAELKVKVRQRWKMLWSRAWHACCRSRQTRLTAQASLQVPAQQRPLNSSGQKALESCTEFHHRVSSSRIPVAFVLLQKSEIVWLPQTTICCGFVDLRVYKYWRGSPSMDAKSIFL